MSEQLSLDLDPEHTWVEDWFDELLAEPVQDVGKDPAWMREQGAARAEEYSLWLDRRRRAELRGVSINIIKQLEASGCSVPFSGR